LLRLRGLGVLGVRDPKTTTSVGDRSRWKLHQYSARLQTEISHHQTRTKYIRLLLFSIINLNIIF